MTAAVTAIAPHDDAELSALRRPFRQALVGVAICFVLIGGLIAAFGTGRDRAEGAAEHWLTEVGDSTRKGVAEDARRYIDEHGGRDSVAALLPTKDTDGKTAFTGLEVGKAATAVDGDIRVPFVVEKRDDAGTKVEGAVVLTKAGDSWHVVGTDVRAPGEKVPSEGGEAIAKAPLGLYAGGALVGLGVTIALSLLIRRLSATSHDH